MLEKDKPPIVPTFAPIFQGKVVLRLHDDASVERWPDLCSVIHGVLDEYNRIVREPGIISIRIDGHVYRVSITCPTEGVQTSLTAPTLVGLFDVLNNACKPAQSEWVPTKNYKDRAGRALRKVVES